MTIALTATAAPPVRDEIVSRLHMRDAVQVVRGFDRPNIHLEVVQARNEDAKRESIVLRAAGEAKPGIVYAATRKDAERYADSLADLGLRACAYHAGMRAPDREHVHAQFLDDQIDVVVATTAFGMGIDKANVRFVIHADVPDSLDSYYQEVGRAGRDGEPAVAVLHYRPEDLGLRRFFSSAAPATVVLQRVAKLLGLHDEPVTVTELRAAARVSASRLTAALNLLEEAGTVRVDADGRVGIATPALTAEECARAAAEVADARRQVELSRVEMVRGYAETTGCRRQFLLGYFGEHYAGACGCCDACDAGADSAAAGTTWRVNDRVVHDAWGSGVVMRCEPDRVTVLFELVGYKTLKLDAVRAAA